MKKNMMKSAFAAIAVSALALSASAISAFAESAEGFTTNLDYNSSEVKPVIEIDEQTITLDQAKNKQTVTLSVKNAGGKFAPTGIHVRYDNRLTIVDNEDGDPATLQQTALKISECVKDGDNALFLTTGATDLTAITWRAPTPR